MTEELTSVPQQPWEKVPPFGEKGEKGEKGAEGPPGAAVTLLFGWIEGSGTKGFGSAGFTSERTAKGKYTIKFTAAFATFCVPVVNIQVAGLATRVAYISALSKTQFSVEVVQAGANEDSPFTFMVTGA